MAHNLIGQRIGNYEITDLLGEGGMGSVYRARHVNIGNVIAIKALDVGRETTDRDRARFLNEAKTLAALKHTNIVSILDFVTKDNQHLTLMEYIDGGNLRQRLEREQGPVRLSFAVNVILQVARGLDFAHNRGIIHRDIKPANILLCDDGRVVLSDFGIAKLMEATTHDLTREGTTVGTPAYMSPEQVAGKPADARSDEYSLGMVLYQMLTGTLPFKVTTPMEMLSQQANTLPPPPSKLNPRIAPEVEAVVLKALAKDPSQRYPRAGDLARALQAAVTGSDQTIDVSSSVAERFQESKVWGRLSALGRKLRPAASSVLAWLVRTALTLFVVLAVATTVIAIGGAYLIGRALESAIANSDFGFQRMGTGQEFQYKSAELASLIEERSGWVLPGALRDLSIQINAPAQLTFRGKVFDTEISLDSTLVQDGEHLVFILERINDVPLPLISNLISGGINRGLSSALAKAQAKVYSLQMDQGQVKIVIDGPAVQVSSVSTSPCGTGKTLNDDFSDIYSGWPNQYETSQVAIGYESGEYSIDVLRPYLSVQPALACPFSKFRATVDVRSLGDAGDAIWGLAFHKVDDNNFTVFEITEKKYYAVEQVSEGKKTFLKVWTPTSSINAGDLVNQLSVTVSADSIEVSINGRALAKIPLEAEPSRGNFGLFVKSVNLGGVQVRFDNLSVQAIP